MEKAQFEAPEIEVIELGGEDVITTSCTTHTPPEEETPAVDPFAG